MKFNLLAPPAMFGQDTQPYGAVFHVCPEISRIFLINLIRSYKLAYSGDLGPSDSLASLSQVHKFPESVRRWFPENLQHACKVDEGPNDDLFSLYQKVTSSDQIKRYEWNDFISKRVWICLNIDTKTLNLISFCYIVSFVSFYLIVSFVSFH
jgi:hypothetical protein